MSIPQIIFYAWLVLILAEGARRIAYGANLRSLAANACEEIVPLAWFLRASVYLAMGVAITCGLLLLRGVWAVYHAYDLSGELQWELAWWILLPVLVGGLALLGRSALKRWIDADLGARGSVDVTIQEISEGIDEGEILELGLEKFPNRIPSSGSGSVTARIAILAASALAVVVLLYAAMAEESPRGSLWVDDLLAGCVELSRDLLPSRLGMPESFDVGVPYAGFTLLFLFLYTNRNYLYYSFVPFLLIQLGCMVAAGVSLAHTGELASARFAAIILLAVPGVRMFLDLKLLRSYKKRSTTLDPVSASLGEAFRADLAALPRRAAKAYPRIDRKELDARLDDGASNVGREAFLAPPRFGRYLKNAAVRWRRFASAVARFMTVDRSVQLVNARSTREAFCYPNVPVWDEERFPLRVPQGYVSWDDPLLLGEEWCVVKQCGTCGGSGETNCIPCSGTGKCNCGTCGGMGYTTRTETYYSGGQSQTRQVQQSCSSCSGGKVTCYGCSGRGKVTCSTCSGTGRLKFDQQLTTSWRADIVASPFPHMTNYELIEGAAEIDFSRKRVIENRRTLEEPAQVLVDHSLTEQGLDGRMDIVGKVFPDWAKRVEKLKGGTTYRAELALCGFTTICATFGKVFKRDGWFFGNRPDFHFPRLPVGYATVGSVIVVPPLVALVAFTVLGAFFGLWEAAEGAAVEVAGR